MCASAATFAADIVHEEYPSTALFKKLEPSTFAQDKHPALLVVSDDKATLI